MVEKTASYKNIIQKGLASWQEFQAKRALRLKQHERQGGGAEKITENIIEDLFTMSLDWCLSEVNNQIQYCDILLTNNGIKHLIIEAKRPLSLTGNYQSIHNALEQAWRYADKQGVKTIAVSDGHILYAADIEDGGLKERLCVYLDKADFPVDLWWLSKHGIYRSRPNYLPTLQSKADTPITDVGPLHPKYNISAQCFAYVGNATKTSTWSLPYLHQSGEVDQKRLPGAINSIISNYRGTKVKKIPEEAIPQVINRLKVAAEKICKMPHQNPKTSACYHKLAEVLVQMSRNEDID